jgi:hypothetical protein
MLKFNQWINGENYFSSSFDCNMIGLRKRCCQLMDIPSRKKAKLDHTSYKKQIRLFCSTLDLHYLCTQICEKEIWL